MQSCDRLHDAEAEADTGGSRGVVAPIEGFDRPRPLGLGNARAVIRHLDLQAGLPGDLDDPQRDRAGRRLEFDCVVDQIADGLRQQVRIAADVNPGGASSVSDTPFSSATGVELDELRRDRGQIDAAESGPPHARVDFR